MLNKTMCAAAVVASLMTAECRSACAQLAIAIDTKDPLTKLSSDQWAYMMAREVNGASVLGRPEVIMLNATPDPLTVYCGRWTLVGPQPYDKQNPNVLPPWTASLVHTDGFDGYCKSGVDAHTPSGESITGNLTSNDGSFSNATFITFKPH